MLIDRIKQPDHPVIRSKKLFLSTQNDEDPNLFSQDSMPQSIK
jgi:hypothetical protein